MADLADFKVKVEVETDEFEQSWNKIVDDIKSGSKTSKQAIAELIVEQDNLIAALEKATKGTAEYEAMDKKLLQTSDLLDRAYSEAGKQVLNVADAHGRIAVQAKKEETKATKELINAEKNAAKEAEKASAEINSFLRKAVINLGQYLAIKKSISVVMGFAKEGEELSRMAQLSGTSAEAIEKLGIALKNYGGSASSASSTLGKLNRQMEDLKLGKKNNLYQVAVQYGLNTNAATPEEMLRNIAKRMEGMGALQQVNMGRKLGLDDATIMLLQQGLEGVNRELEKAGKLTVFSKEDIENATKMQRAYREFQERFEQLKATLVRGFLPVFQTIFEMLGRIATYFKEHPGLLKAIGTTAAIVFGGLLIWLHPILFLFGLLAAAVALLIDDWQGFKEGAESALEPLWKFLNWLIEKNALGAVLAGVLLIAAALWLWLAPTTPILVVFLGIIAACFLLQKALTWCWEKLKQFWEYLKTVNWGEVWTAITESAKEAWGAMIDYLKEAWVKFKDWLKGTWVGKMWAKIAKDSGEDLKDESATDIGRSYVSKADANPFNTITPSSMTMMNNTNQEQNQSTVWNVGQVTINQKNNESAQQTMIDWTANASPAY